MKHFISLFLCLLLFVSIFTGCNGSNTETTPTKHTLTVGFGRADITPEKSVPLGGYGNTEQRMSNSVTNRLYATCIAMTDENDNTVLLFHLDLIHCTDAVLWAKSAVAKATGIPYNQIMTAATHTHSAPDTGQTSFPSVEEYNDSLKQWLTQAAQDALADRKEAQVYTTTVYPQGLNYVRHYIMSDGSIAGDNFGDVAGKTYVKHVSDADNAMQLIKFTREGGKDILLMNWQGHPHRDGGSTKYNISADIVGVIRDEVEAALDCNFAYFTGASGNVNNNSNIKAEQITKGSSGHGKALAQYAIEASDYKQVDTGNVQYTYQLYKADASNAREQIDLPMSVFSIGDVGFIIAPYEMFDANGMEIKENSPFDMTFIVTCANGKYGYVPSLPTFDYGGYEVSRCSLAPGMGESLAQEYVTMLNSLYQTRK